MKRLVSVLLSVIMLVLLFTTAMTAQNSQNDNTPYAYPVTPGSSEWGNFTPQQMHDACQIPEDKLKGMTTEALLETVLDYPLILDYMAFNTLEDACNAMSEEFNGFNELFSREDVTSAILDRYESSKVLNADEAEEADAEELFEAGTIEYLLICDEIKNGGLTEEEADRFNALHDEKNAERKAAGIYSEQSDVYSGYKNHPDRE